MIAKPKEWTHKNVIKHFVEWFKDQRVGCLGDNTDGLINKYLNQMDFELRITEIDE